MPQQQVETNKVHHHYQQPPPPPSNNLTGFHSNSFYATTPAPQQPKYNSTRAPQHFGEVPAFQDHMVAKETVARDTAYQQPDPVHFISNTLSGIDLGLSKKVQVSKENRPQVANQNDQKQKVQSWAAIASKPAKTAVAGGKQKQVAKQPSSQGGLLPGKPKEVVPSTFGGGNKVASPQKNWGNKNFGKFPRFVC